MSFLRKIGFYWKYLNLVTKNIKLYLHCKTCIYAYNIVVWLQGAQWAIKGSAVSVSRCISSASTSHSASLIDNNIYNIMQHFYLMRQLLNINTELSVSITKLHKNIKTMMNIHGRICCSVVVQLNFSTLNFIFPQILAEFESFLDCLFSDNSSE